MMIIDNEWLRLRLIELGYDKGEVNTHVDACRIYLAIAGVCDCDAFNRMVNDLYVKQGLEAIYREVVKRDPLVLDPIALCRWGAILFMSRDCARRDRITYCLREFILQHKESQENLAKFIGEKPAAKAKRRARKR
jgi:hypothetical protein